jgi:hypothetical protein
VTRFLRSRELSAALAGLPPDAFADELLPEVLDAVRRNDPEGLALTLAAWRAACEVRGDEELAQALRAPRAAVAPTRVRVAPFSASASAA